MFFHNLTIAARNEESIVRDHSRYGMKNINGAFDHHFGHPRHRINNHENHDDNFEDDGNRLLLDLGQCL